MGALEASLRRQLEHAVLAARASAENGARKALNFLGVDQESPPQHLTDSQRELHRRLRAQAHMLADGQDLKHLVEKTAYDHWHRLLFSRFLVENRLLLHPEHHVALELSDLADLAAEEGIREPWDLAARYTAAVLPAIFRKDDPVGELALPSEDRGELLRLLKELPVEVFQADDSLGWVYQFWRAEEKNTVNASGGKINADTLPAVTQLFTEHYMVEFLLHNSLGAWWTAKVEAAGRTSAIPLPYLRRKEDGSPAAGAFSHWPKTVRELRVLDPCCGSGHFLVALLQLLVAMLREEENLSVEGAVRVVLADILHGLEIDARCTQLAAFNVAFAAWRLIGRPDGLPPLRIACSGLSVGATRDEWLAAVEEKDARFLIGQIYNLFKKAPELGSLINPARISNIGQKASDLLPAVRGLLAADPLANPEWHELGVTAKGFAEATEILGRAFHLVTTNVPYLGRGKQDEILQEYCERIYPNAKSDLATSFVERCLEFCSNSGSAALVTPQNWLALKITTALRQRLLIRTTWNMVARLGPKGFQTPMWDFNVQLGMISKVEPDEGHVMFGIDVSSAKDPQAKAAELVKASLWRGEQRHQLDNPYSRITFTSSSDEPRLSEYADTWQGLVTGDTRRFTLNFWEVSERGSIWEWLISTPETNGTYVGRELIVRWEGSKGALHNSTAHNFPPTAALGRHGVLLSQFGVIRATTYTGEIFNDLSVPLIPRNPAHLPAIMALCTHESFNELVRAQTQSLQVRVGYFLGIPFNLAHWERVAAEKYPNGLPKPHSDDPTQWLFGGQPQGSLYPLQVAVARLLGYCWPRQTGSEFLDCPALGPDGLGSFADDDGIVCLNAIKGETPCADRLQSILGATFGSEWSAEKLSELLAESGARSLEDWLRNYFFEEHCSIFHQRPFLWQIWDGRKDGFSAIVNYHRMDRSTLEKLTYAYLGDWLRRQQAAKEAGEAGSDARHQAARELQEKLKLIIEGEPPYDIFVRWKPIEKQALGWEPDLNDGVRMNIRPFVTAEILRKVPKINWRKDRGKDVPSTPWYSVFNGERINDHHLTLAQKRAAKPAAAAVIA